MAADLLARVRAEIEQRLVELRPAVVEYECLLAAAESLHEEGEAPLAIASAPARKGCHAGGTRRPRGRRQLRVGAAERAILAALEHGSHTLAELGLVTARSASELREGVKRLLAAGRITRASREGRAAYALAGSE
jgi:hypothetical protein